MNPSLSSPFLSGSFVECRYRLMTYGIPCAILPVTDDGECLVNYHKEWIAKRRQLEQQNLASESRPQNHHDTTSNNSRRQIVVPGSNDVLLGRDKMVLHHSGNYRFKHLISSYQDQYDKSPRMEKTIIATEIVGTIQRLGGRFLKKEKDSGWIEVEDKVAREKVSNAFRDRRKKVHLSGVDSSAASTSSEEAAKTRQQGDSATSSRSSPPSSMLEPSSFSADYGDSKKGSSNHSYVKRPRLFI